MLSRAQNSLSYAKYILYPRLRAGPFLVNIDTLAFSTCKTPKTDKKTLIRPPDNFSAFKSKHMLSHEDGAFENPNLR